MVLFAVILSIAFCVSANETGWGKLSRKKLSFAGDQLHPVVIEEYLSVLTVRGKAGFFAAVQICFCQLQPGFQLNRHRCNGNTSEKFCDDTAV